MVELDGFSLMFDQRDDVSGANPGGARAILNVEVDDHSATAARLDGLGARWVSPLEDRDGSSFGTLEDPDGRCQGSRGRSRGFVGADEFVPHSSACSTSEDCPAGG